MSIELNAFNAKKVASGVMKRKGMFLRKGFVPVKSEYLLQKNNDNRYRIIVSENELKILGEHLSNGKEWMLKSIGNFKGPRELIEEKLANFISIVMNKNK